MPGGECLGESETLTRFPSPVNSIRLTDTAALARSNFRLGYASGAAQLDCCHGERVSVSGMTSGKIVEGWVNWDALGLLQQLEVVAVQAKGASPRIN